MPLSEKEAHELGTDEQHRWSQAHQNIVEEIRRTSSDFDRDRKEARVLTSEIVATRRVEDKVQLINEEVVTHSLSSLRRGQTHGLDSLFDQPYFARVVTLEEDGREIEFRLGTASFPKERIIDWRKAPISKLYYDYQEGDEFSEIIQGQEREGSILLRRSFQGRRDDLRVVEFPGGKIVKNGNEWVFEDKHDQFSRTGEHDGHLPPILSLITPEQFRLITRDPQKPMLIQGIAGSGKTTVALHRLAWLLHEDNSDAKPEKSLVVMFNRSLKTYVETTLPELKVQGVPILTYSQWINSLAHDIVGPRPRGAFKRTRDLELFKSSSYCLRWIRTFVEKHAEDHNDYLKQLFSFYRFLLKQDVFWRGWDRVRPVLEQQCIEEVTDLQDDSVLLHLVFLRHGFYPVKDPGVLGVCDHIVIDEAQDFGALEIMALLNALDRDRSVTIVGDVGQKIVASRDFASWEQILNEVGFEETTPIQLTVSYRSTEEIMALAAMVRKEISRELGSQTGGRHGDVPMYLRTGNRPLMVDGIAQWIRERLDESQRAHCAIICRWPKQAQELVNELRQKGFPSVRLGHREQFDFSPGVTITNVHQVKGLEFRCVLVVEPSPEHYRPEDEEERNLLYVAITRAEKKLDFIGYGKLTPLLQGCLR